jgi:hypothetical protein
MSVMLNWILPCALPGEVQKPGQSASDRDTSTRLLSGFAATQEVDETALEVDMACHCIRLPLQPEDRPHPVPGVDPEQNEQRQVMARFLLVTRGT